MFQFWLSLIVYRNKGECMWVAPNPLRYVESTRVRGCVSASVRATKVFGVSWLQKSKDHTVGCPLNAPTVNWVAGYRSLRTS